jgi:hypothetical protein
LKNFGYCPTFCLSGIPGSAIAGVGNTHPATKTGPPGGAVTWMKKI